MSSISTYKVPFLRKQRQFPQESQALSVEIDRAYTDIANSVNSRTISLFTQNRSIQNGESWSISGSQYNGFRQFYLVTGTGNIAHGINLSTIYGFTKIYGSFKDGSNNWYPLPYVDATAANNQISLSVTSTNIVITAGAGAPPAIVSGFVILEWLSFP